MNHNKHFGFRLILLILLLTLPVLACNAFPGGEDDGTAVVTVEVASQVNATDTPDGAAGNEVDTTEQQAGEEQASPTADAHRDPTETPVGNDSASAEPTETPVPEAIGRSETGGNDGGDGDQNSSSDGWGVSESGRQSACDHPYLPFRTGATWTYNDGQDSMIWEVTDVQGDLNNATAVLRVTVGATSIDYHWSCESGSGLASFDFANLGSSAVGIDLTLEQIEADGQFLLPEDQLQLGATWESNLESPISFTQGVGDTQINATGVMITVQTNEVLSTDPVTFEDLTVPGVQIKQTDNISLELSLFGSTVNQSMSLAITNNLGRGIGMVTQSSVSDFGTTTTQLVSYYIP